MSDLRLYRWLAGQARPAWPRIAALLLVGLLASPLALLTPLPLKIAVDGVLDARPLPGFLDAVVPTVVTRSATTLLVLVAGLAVLIALLSQLQDLASKYLTAAAGEMLVRDFRARLFSHLQRLSLSYHDSTGTADSVYRIQQDAAAVRSIAIDGLIPLVSSAVTLAGMAYVMARIDWQLALAALTVSPPLLVVAHTYRPRLRKQSREVKKLESAAIGVVHEALGALRVVKTFGQEEREGERFVRRSDEGVRGRIGLALVEGRFNLLVGLIVAVGTAAVLLIGVGHVRAGLLSLGDLLLVMGYVGKLYEPMKTIGRKVATLQGHLASAERAFALLDQRPDVPERARARPLARAAGAVAYRNVCFAYDADHAVLHDVSFEAPPGARVAIVGTTGAGKTTLVSLLTRFYDPTDGAILLDGVDLRDYRLADLRNQFAMVLQESVLFSTSIAENIAYGRPGASESAIVHAAQAAGAHDFVARLPRGYATPVGERGMQLSGGERQRVALARAFLKDAPLLILDEPTSSVDPKTEAAILEAMDRLMRGRTAFLITHRASALATCDLHLRLERGRLVEATPALVGQER
jgi:ATP-binding cassette, subfamily B, bacterial